ncbi:IclR family transcriptional regulator C-terminal domain-containing protein [Streptomyces racemochromogenes]|uniref:IclR family transcriptional regulator C-terminal domain-containing protein n=1 Tax=Streptomyces racemochromogenes TaxID=67353 RepID=A0ABW7PCT2_9ACTN
MVCDPRAGRDLRRFVDGGHADLPGAVVFGCLLHLAGLRDGARFWWQFAAGSAAARTAPAAYCLFLDHSRCGEHHDARHWARELGRRGFRPGGRRELREVRLCAQAAVLRYVDQCDDPDLGPVPVPRAELPGVLAAFLPPAPLPEHRPRPAAGPPRHLAPASGTRGTAVRGDTGGALEQARRALDVVRVLERHPLGVRAGQLARKSGLTEAALRPLLALLCEEEYAYRPGAGVYAAGPALDRLAAPGGGGLADQLQRTLALARDSAGAAVYLSRYADGEVRITQMADGPGAPPVREWVDFRAAAHASAVGKCLLTQLDHRVRADHVARHRPARLTPHTITDSRALFSALDAVAPGAPVFDLREYSPGVVCSAVPIATGGAAGSLALSLPAAHAHRLREATEALRRKAVPVLLALLLSGAIPPHTPAQDPPPAAGAPAPETLRHLGRLFRTPLTRFTASTAGPHLVSDSASGAAYLFGALPEGDGPRLALPQTLGPLAPGSLPAPEGLVVLRT